MADTNTANEWKQVVENKKAKLATLKNSFASIDSDISSTNAEIISATNLRNRLLANALELEKNSTNITAEIINARRQVKVAEDNLEKLTSSKIKLESFKQDYLLRVAELETEINLANQQVEIAEETPLGPPGTNPLIETPPPVNAGPGNNTDVDNDPFEAARLDAEGRTSTPVTQADVENAINDDIIRQYEQAEANAAALDEAARNTASAAQLEFGLNQNVSAGVTAAQISGKSYEAEISKVRDWRFRISLAKTANYLYKAQDAGILEPLKATNGVIFPYTPTIQVTYAANYDSPDITHSNYKVYNYRSSSVENLSITGDFTAQDTYEARYLLAVIHFFRSATKMFYGKDSGPIRGIPPPLCYINGHGDYAFNEHPVVITSFALNYPNDVDYINAGSNFGSSNLDPGLTPYRYPQISGNVSNDRRRAAGLQPGGLPPPPKFFQNAASDYNTRVPTRVQLQIQCLPIITRKNISNNFSLKDYARGELLLGKTNGIGGIW